MKRRFTRFLTLKTKININNKFVGVNLKKNVQKLKNEYEFFRLLMLVTVKYLWMQTSQLGNQLNLTCLNNNRTKFYTLGIGSNQAELEELCVDLCKWHYVQQQQLIAVVFNLLQLPENVERRDEETDATFFTSLASSFCNFFHILFLLYLVIGFRSKLFIYKYM